MQNNTDTVEQNLQKLALAPTAEESVTMPVIHALHNDPDWIVINVSGKDKIDFLQRMLSCDLKLLSESQALPGALCDIQGRVKCVLLLFYYQQQLYMLAPIASGDAMLQHIKKFILRDDVQFAQTDQLAITGMAPVAQPTTATVWGCTHSKENAAEHRMDIAMPGGGRCLRIEEQVQQQQQAGDPQMRQAWRQLDILGGIPWQFSTEHGHYLPQDLALHKLGAVHFDKGCYPGQEIIIRVQHRNRAKHGTYYCSSEHKLTDGAKIHTKDDQQAGEILYSAQTKDKQYAALLVVSGQRLDTELYHEQQPIKLYRLELDNGQATAG